MEEEEIKPWEPGKVYKIGDMVTSHLGDEFIAPDYSMNTYTFILRRIVENPTSPNFYYYGGVVMPNDPGYQEYIKDIPWELVWPEWSAEGKYGWGSLVVYKGRYYLGSIRMFFDFSQPERPLRALPNSSPDVLVDEEGVRGWTIYSTKVWYPSYNLAPFHLERPGNYDDTRTQKKDYSPYWREVEPISWKNGVRFPGFWEGVSIEVYQGSPATNDDPATPPSSELICGAALQSLQLGVIGFNLQVLANGTPEDAEPDENGDSSVLLGWGYSGDTPASPDYNYWADFQEGEEPDPVTGLRPGFGFEEGQTRPKGTPATIRNDYPWRATGQLYYSHNHPLFFKRNVTVRHSYQYTKSYWKYYPQTIKWYDVVGYPDPGIYDPPPEPDWWRDGEYALQGNTLYSIKNGTFSPKEDCWSVGGPQKPKHNSIGSFTLPTGDFVTSTGISHGPHGFASPDVKVESN